MMCELLKDWLKDFDQDIERQHRKVLFLLDNCSAQKVSIMPKAARFVLLWQNATSALRPLDKGTIRSPKCHSGSIWWCSLFLTSIHT